jgi:hypothetical protein
MEFEIKIHVEGKAYRMQVARIYEGDSIEKWAIIGGSRGIILRNNRPELRSKQSNKKPLWQIEEGTVTNRQSFALTVLAIEKKIEEIENPPKPITHWKNSTKAI